jgi:PhnB protein
MQINAYLNFNGTCREAFDFYARGLGGTINAVHTFGEMPGDQVPVEFRDRIMHISMSVGDQVLMGSDTFPGGPPDEGHKGFAVSLQIESPDQAERVFAALSEGANVTMPLQQTFFAERFGMLEDRYNIPWMIHCQGSSH